MAVWCPWSTWDQEKGGNSLYNFWFMSYMDTKLPPGDFYSVKEIIRREVFESREPMRLKA